MSTLVPAVFIRKRRRKVKDPDALVERHAFTIQWTATQMRRGYKLNREDFEDLKSAGYARLAKLIAEKDSRLEPAKWFVDQCIRNAMSDALTRSILPYKTRFADKFVDWNNEADNQLGGGEDTNHNGLNQIVDGDANPENAIINAETLSCLLTYLSPDEQELLALRWGLNDNDEHSIDQIAALRHWGAHRTRTTFTRIMLKLRSNASIPIKK